MDSTPERMSNFPVTGARSPPLVSTPQVISSPLANVVSAEKSCILPSEPGSPIAISRLQEVKDNKPGSDSHPILSQTPRIQINSQPILAYNEYSELVDFASATEIPRPQELDATQILRLVHKAYRREIRASLREVIHCKMDGISSLIIGMEGESFLKTAISSWDLSRHTSKEKDLTSDELHNIRIYHGPPRILELGCDEGSWCFAAKEQHPNLIVEGIDEVDRWTRRRLDIQIKDFMKPEPTGPSINDAQAEESVNCFAGLRLTQTYPEFNVRPFDSLQLHAKPIPRNLYSFIRGSMFFDRVENWMQFMDEVRQILKPGGVVEFIEIDPRPRSNIAYRRRSSVNTHNSRAATDWTHDIADRFKNPNDDYLAMKCPQWMKRVEERHAAILRPIDGYAAEKMQERLEGIGFYDVKDFVFPLVIGGDTQQGKLLQETLSNQIAVEDSIPVLRDFLPDVKVEDIASGEYYLNLHVCTARKPEVPRPGDLLLNGQRKEMSFHTYDAMRRLNDATSNQWKRFNLDAKLTKMMKEVSGLGGGLLWTPGGVSSYSRRRMISREASQGSSEMIDYDCKDPECTSCNTLLHLSKVPKSEFVGDISNANPEKTLSPEHRHASSLHSRKHSIEGGAGEREELD